MPPLIGKVRLARKDLAVFTVHTNPVMIEMINSLLIRVFAVETQVGARTVHSFSSRKDKDQWLAEQPQTRQSIDASARTVCRAKFHEEIVSHSSTETAALKAAVAAAVAAATVQFKATATAIARIEAEDAADDLWLATFKNSEALKTIPVRTADYESEELPVMKPLAMEAAAS
jgi:hypothetical protein